MNLVVQDIGFLFVVALQVGLFGAGAVRLARSPRLAALQLDAAMATSAAMLAVLALGMLVGILHLPAIAIGAVIVVALQVTGGFELWQRRRALVATLKSKPAAASCLALVVLLGTIHWIHNLRDLPGLPTHHDGIAHTAFFLRLLDGGTPFINITPLAFQKEFGADVFNYYPTGVHALVAMFEAPLLRTGASYAAPLLKGWMTLAAILSAVTAWWMSRLILPRRSEWLYLLVALSAMTFFRYPVWGTDSGGFSRIVAQAVFLPLGLALVLRRQWLSSFAATLFVVGVMPVTLFHLHPGIFGLLGFTICAVLPFAFDKKAVVNVGVSGVVAVLLLFGFLFWTGSNAVVDAGTLQPKHLEFSLAALKDRFYGYSESLLVDPAFLERYKVSFRTVLTLFGLVAVVTGISLPRKDTDRAARAYPLLVIGTGAVVLLFTFSPYPALVRAGHIFFNETGRVVEILYTAEVVLWTAGAGLLGWIFAKLSRRANRRIVAGLGVVLGAVFLYDFRIGWRFNTHHLDKYFTVYGSPRRSSSEALAEVVRQKTEPNAVLLYTPFSLDSFEARTGRSGMFMYQECPFGQDTSNCKKRQALLERTRSVIKERAAGPTPDRDCLIDELGVFGRPVYVSIEEAWFDALPVNAAGERTLCRNVSVLGRVDGASLVSFHPAPVNSTANN